jgi:hypothetical protein
MLQASRQTGAFVAQAKREFRGQAAITIPR